MPKQLPLNTSVQAEYEDGYIHDETAHADVSPYGPFEIIDYDEDGKEYRTLVDKNVFNDILEKRPEAEHGKMVRFSVFWSNARYDVNWVGLPDNARPIRFRDGFFSQNLDTGEQSQGWSGIKFGYQYNDETGKNIQEVKEL